VALAIVRGIEDALGHSLDRLDDHVRRRWASLHSAIAHAERLNADENFSDSSVLIDIQAILRAAKNVTDDDSMIVDEESEIEDADEVDSPTTPVPRRSQKATVKSGKARAAPLDDPKDKTSTKYLGFDAGKHQKWSTPVRFSFVRFSSFSDFLS
jgi:hypothetical protein